MSREKYRRIAEVVMKSDLIRRWPAYFVAVMVSLGVPLAAQDKPDFSGSWILESGSPGADIPQALSVSQSLVRTNVRGEPMQPFFRDIKVTRALPNSTRSETYLIGVTGGTVPGLLANGSESGPRTHQRVAWEQQALIIESGSYTGPAPETGDWAERREVWSFDSDVRLRLAITTRSSVDAPRTVTLVYRRQ
jgi:hypothetical protein